jgi:hypothetical protein
MNAFCLGSPREISQRQVDPKVFGIYRNRTVGASVYELGKWNFYAYTGIILKYIPEIYYIKRLVRMGSEYTNMAVLNITMVLKCYFF